MDDIAAIRSVLENSPLFRGCDPSIIRGSFVMTFKRGESVSETQNGIECVGVVISGSLTVEATEGSSVSVIKRGGEFGICNIFVHENMPTKLWARVGSKVLFIPKDEFARLLGTDNALMYRYVKLCNEKMLYLAERLRLISITDSSERLMCFLESKAQNGSVKLPFSKDELARQLGISRSSLFRALKTLENSDRLIPLSANTYLIRPQKSNT